MSLKTLFVAWQDTRSTRRWFPVGRLDADPSKSIYRFRYVRGARIAQDIAGFPLLVDFPELQKDYKAGELFPLFRNRVISTSRPDFSDYLDQLDLPKKADPIEILSVNGGHRATDSLEVFPKPEQERDGSLQCRFFLHGLRHLSERARQRVRLLQAGEALHVALELTNPVTQLAVQLQTEDYVMIGWAPHYLVPDLARSVAQSHGDFSAKVIKKNPAPAPSKQRLLIELRGPWPEPDPMTDQEFEPLVF